MVLTFNSNSNKLMVSCQITNNGEVYGCMINGPSSATEVSANFLTATSSVLNQVQTIEPKSYIPPLQTLLKKVDNSNINSTIANSNYVQTVTNEFGTTIFSWTPVFNGLNYTGDDLTLQFRSGYFGIDINFFNGLDLYTVGNTNVNMSEPQAIQKAENTAIQTVDSVTIPGNNSVEQGKQTSQNVAIASNFVTADLILSTRDNSSVFPKALYPAWCIVVPLKQMLPGGVTEIEVGIWADTSQIAYNTRGGYFGPPSSSVPTVSTSTQLPVEYVLGIASTIVAATIDSVYLFYKRKR